MSIESDESFVYLKKKRKGKRKEKRLKETLPASGERKLSRGDDSS